MGQLSFFEINLSIYGFSQYIREPLQQIEKTNDNKIKNIYRILDKSKDSVSLSIITIPKHQQK